MGNIMKNESFSEMVASFKKRVTESNNISLRILWDMGGVIEDIKNKGKYGEHTVSSFVKELSGYGLCDKTAYKYAQFHREYTEQELQESLARNKIGWGAISRLLGKISNDKESRAELEEKVSANELPLGDLKAAAQSVVAQLPVDTNNSKPDKRSNKPSLPSCTKGVKKVISLLENMKSSIILVDNDIQDLDLLAEDPVKYNKALDAFFDLRELLDDVNPALIMLNKKCLKVS